MAGTSTFFAISCCVNVPQKVYTLNPMVLSIRTYLLVFLACCTAGQHACAQATAPPAPGGATIPLSKIPRVQRAPKISDFLENQPREAEFTVNDFREYLPGDGLPATESTVAHLSYDAKNLYVIFECKDDPALIRAHLSKREEIGQDDGVGILLDTFRDFHRAYYFTSNALGVQADAIYTEGQSYDFSFDTVWESEGRITKDGFIVWYAIPFKSLRFSRAPEQTWGIALYRSILRKNEYDYWPYITQRAEGITQQFAAVGGLDELSPGRNMQFIPYGLLAGNHFLNQPDPPNAQTPPAFRNAFEHRAGLDAKFVAKDALAFDLTLNPDFSQVESDDPQVTVNQRFAVFFPEKRPFFIENAAFFSTPVELFFSRQIADPQFGVRMTGKLGPWTLGALLIDDRQPGQGYSSGAYATRAADGVVRVTREFGNQSFIGAFLSSRDFADTDNRIASLDARVKFSRNLILTAQTAHSWERQDQKAPQLCQQSTATSQKPGSQQGNASEVQLSYLGRNWALTSLYDDISPNFCAELGFVPRTDIRRAEQIVDYFWRPNKHKIVDFGPLTSSVVNWNRNGQLQDWETDLGFAVDWTQQTSATFTRSEAYELFQGIGFRKHGTLLGFSTAPRNWFAVNARFITGIQENYYPGPGVLPNQPFLGNLKRFNLGFTLRPVSRLRFDETYLYYRLGARNGSTPAGFSPDRNILNNHLMRSKVNYQFTKEFSLRVILDYNATLANSQLVDLQRELGSYEQGPTQPTKRLTGDVLFTYLLHPGTAVYAGYTDNYTNLFLDATAPSGVGLQRAATTGTGRVVFVKLSYLLRF